MYSTESESGDGDDSETDLPDDGFTGTGTGIWTTILGEDVGPVPFDFTPNPGPHHAPNPDAPPLEYVKLFLDDDLIDHLVDETNIYAAQWIEQHQEFLHQHPRSRVRQWIRHGRTTKEEMYAFLAVSINMGLNKKPLLESYFDSTHPSQYIPWFSDHFSRDRFSLLMKFMHMNNNATLPPPDHPDHKLYKIKPLVTKLCKKFQRFYVPHRNISIDESMIGYKGKTPHLRQFMPNKQHARFGIKLWCLCDAGSSYTSHFEVYKGAVDPAERHEEGMTYSLVLRMMESTNLLHCGHHLGIDNYFTSPKLLDDLYSAHTSATGTVRKNRKGLPRSVTGAKLANKTVIERRRGNLLCVGYKDNKRQPILLSTHAAGGFATSVNSKGKERHLPKVVIAYNSSMGGVDMADARLYTYLCERRTMKWTNKVLFALIGRAVLNAYVIYSENTAQTKKLSRFAFNVSVVEAMVGNFRPPLKVRQRRRSRAEIALARQAPIAPPAQDNLVQPGPSGCKLAKLPQGKKRDCVHKHLKRKRTMYECPKCDKGLSALCFTPYHQERGLF